MTPGKSLSKHISKGNKKLPQTTWIFNLSSATDCESKKRGLCQLCNVAKCYAMTAERIYKAVLPYRRRQQQIWKDTKVSDFCNTVIDMKSRSKVKCTSFRFNEAGDFTCQQDILKAEYVARVLYRNGIKTYCYTARSDLDFSQCKYLIVNGSGFQPNTSNSNMFYVKGQDTWQNKLTGKNVRSCDCDCSVCDLCQVGNQYTIGVNLH